MIIFKHHHCAFNSLPMTCDLNVKVRYFAALQLLAFYVYTELTLTFIFLTKYNYPPPNLKFHKGV